jgi:hypothetical protein
VLEPSGSDFISNPSAGRDVKSLMKICEPMNLSLATGICALPLIALAHPAFAQCTPNDTIYIDPRLVPHRPHFTPEGLTQLFASGYISAAQKQELFQQALTQNDPIKMPMSNGYVLISPTNPCIQQFVPAR